MKSRAVPTYNENFMDYSKRRSQGRHRWADRVTRSGGGVISADAGALAGVRAFFLVAAFVDAFQPAFDDLLELSDLLEFFGVFRFHEGLWCDWAPRRGPTDEYKKDQRQYRDRLQDRNGVAMGQGNCC